MAHTNPLKLGGRFTSFGTAAKQINAKEDSQYVNEDLKLTTGEVDVVQNSLFNFSSSLTMRNPTGQSIMITDIDLLRKL